MNHSRCSAVVGWVGLALGVLGGILMAISGPHIARFFADLERAEANAIRISEQNQRLELPPGKTYGIWVEDRDNSGYSYGGCFITDEHGRSIRTDEAAPTIATETGEFEFQFATGNGRITVVDCVARGAGTSVREAHRFPGGHVLVALLGGMLLLAGAGMVVAWALSRRSNSKAPSDSRPVPWRWGLLWSTASVAVYVLIMSVGTALLLRELHPPASSQAYRTALLNPMSIGFWGLLAALALVTFLAIGRRRAITNINTELRSSSRWALILIPFAAFFAVAPIVMGIFALAFSVISDEVAATPDEPSHESHTAPHREPMTLDQIARELGCENPSKAPPPSGFDFDPGIAVCLKGNQLIEIHTFPDNASRDAGIKDIADANDGSRPFEQGTSWAAYELSSSDE